MARGRKPALSLEDQLAKVNSEIENTESTLKELKKTKKELEDRIHQNKLSELDAFISEQGLSIDELKELLSNH